MDSVSSLTVNLLIWYAYVLIYWLKMPGFQYMDLKVRGLRNLGTRFLDFHYGYHSSFRVYVSTFSCLLSESVKKGKYAFEAVIIKHFCSQRFLTPLRVCWSLPARRTPLNLSYSRIECDNLKLDVLIKFICGKIQVLLRCDL